MAKYTERITLEVELEVEFDFNEPERGKREKSGLQLEPDWPASVEIIDVLPIISDEDERVIKQKILEIQSEKQELNERYYQ